jgi:hypothetical protein
MVEHPGAETDLQIISGVPAILKTSRVISEPGRAREALPFVLYASTDRKGIKAEYSTSRAKQVNSRKRSRKKAVGKAKLEKSAASELTKRSDSIVESVLDGVAEEEFKGIRFLCDLAGDSTNNEESLCGRRSIALELAAEPPWRPEPADAETNGTPEPESERDS